MKSKEIGSMAGGMVYGMAGDVWEYADDEYETNGVHVEGHGDKA